ncbi:hypothetical protein PVAP13_6NG172000 [Panicum virgatum]|uniref:Peptidase A1 domain-containing protein n=1 Tax=Panicum virgatum TaxID=38727 RepID=A0A8T0QXC6_PANVG|nr:hypothetical protein PVAP13_6NG172000 [Panicum virgatum]
MATVSKLLLLLLCSYYSLIAHAGEHSSYITGSVKTEAVCSEPKASPSSSDGGTVTLHHRHGPCSLLAPTKATPTMEEILLSDQLRASNIQRKLSGATDGTGGAQELEATLPTTLGTALETLQYVINVSIGTPAVSQTVMIDTSSDVSWVHCKPCSPCHSQVDPTFDPSMSSTYSAFPCSSAPSAQLGAGCSSSQCHYIVRYLDGSNTTGTYGSDTLTLGANVITGFQFGCSRTGTGLDGDKTAGLMGLGGDVQSLVSQTAGTFGRVFCWRRSRANTRMRLIAR